MSEKKESAFFVVKNTLKYFLPIAWKTHKGYFFVGFFGIIVGAVQPFVTIMTTPLIIEELLGDRNITKLLLYVAVIAVGGTLLSFIGSWLGQVLSRYDEKFQNYFTEEMSRRIMELDFQHTEDKKALDQAEAARTGMSWYSGGVHGVITPIFGMATALFKIIGAVTLIAVYAPWLFLVTLVIVGLNALVQNKENKIEATHFSRLSKINRVFGYLGWSLTDFRYGKDIRLYGAQDMMVEKWDHYSDENLLEWKGQADDSLPYEITKTLLGVARDMATYFYLGITVLTGGISVAVFVQMSSVGYTFHDAMSVLLGNVQQIVKRTGYAYEYVKFMNYPSAIEKGTRHVEDKPHTIEFRNVSFAYPNTDIKVLDGVSVTLRQGEHLSVVGLNGAGKTTFVKLLCRLYDPTGGEIILDGINIKEYDYEEYMAVFSPVFQDFKLFAFTVKENIALDGDCDEDGITDLTDRVGLHDKITSLENGTDTVLFKAFDEDGIEPSGGEQQKIAIARALFKKSPVVILDEPTAALDPVAEYDIYRQFDTLVGGKTAIYISHRLSSCKFCDKIAVFSGGKIAEYGTHDQLVEIENGIYSEMFAAQAQYYN